MSAMVGRVKGARPLTISKARTRRQNVAAMIDQVGHGVARGTCSPGAEETAWRGEFVWLGKGFILNRPVLRRQFFGEAEVKDLSPAVFGQEEVFGFQVPMNDVVFVRGKDGSDLAGHSERLGRGKGTAVKARSQVSPSRSSETGKG